MKLNRFGKQKRLHTSGWSWKKTRVERPVRVRSTRVERKNAEKKAAQERAERYAKRSGPTLTLRQVIFREARKFSPVRSYKGALKCLRKNAPNLFYQLRRKGGK